MTSNIVEFLDRIKKRIQIPKIYAIVFHDVSGEILDIDGNDKGLRLHLSATYDLEEAIHIFINKNKGRSGVWRPLLWSSMDIDELRDGLFEVGAIMTNEEIKKKNIMKQILDKRDLKVLEKNKKILSKAEYEYLKEKMFSKKAKPKK